MSRLIYGVGLNDHPFSVNAKGNRYKPYYRWGGILERCYSGKYDRYKDTYVCDEWLIFSNFDKWLNNTKWNELHELGLNPCIDKDILGDSKLYSPDTCIVVPKKVNDAFQFGDGYSFNIIENKFKAYSRCFKTGKTINLGTYKTEVEAINARKNYDKIKLEEICSYLLDIGYDSKLIDRIKERQLSENV